MGILVHTDLHLRLERLGRLLAIQKKQIPMAAGFALQP